MNTEITFYCTHLEYGEFRKTIFSTIIEGTFEEYWEEHNWLDDNIPNICKNFNLELVFDWIFIYSNKVEKSKKTIYIVDSFKGKLVFDDDLEYQLMKIKSENYDILKETEKLKKDQKELKEEKPKKKNYPSVWIDLSGKSYIVEFACHEEFAIHYLNSIGEKNDYCSSNRYAYEQLQDKGWIRILGWYDPPQFVITKVNPKQKTTLREYCIKNEVKYQDFPEILKS